MKDIQELEQAKQRNKKIYITDIAIDKVPYVRYYEFTDEQNKAMLKSSGKKFCNRRNIYGIFDISVQM